MIKVYVTANVLVNLLISKDNKEVETLLTLAETKRISLYMSLVSFFEAYNELTIFHQLGKDDVVHAFYHLIESEDLAVEGQSFLEYVLHHSMTNEKDMREIYHQEKARQNQMVITEADYLSTLT